MKIKRAFQNLYVVIAIIGMFLCSSSAWAATPPSWKETGFSINADGMHLREVLNEFAAAYGVRVSFGVGENGALHGKIKSESGTEFLNRLANSHEFRWFVYNDTLYVVPKSDYTSLRLHVGEDSVQDAKAALVGLGLLDTRFGWGELPDEGVVLISGPREYVNLARQVLQPDADPVEEKKESLREKQLMVFKLKYANATDRVITTRGKSETIPGIKTILSDLVSSESMDAPKSSPRKKSERKFDVGSEKQSRQPAGSENRAEIGQTDAAIMARQGNVEREDDLANSSTQSRGGRPHIDADPSRNAIIIYDYGSKRALYQSLIDQLDVEPQQIEIEAMIVDVDRNKMAQMGVSWGSTTNGNFNADGIPQPGSSLLITDSSVFYAKIKAMEGAGDARVLAKPSVLTLDNLAAVLDLNQTAYVPLVGERVTSLADVTAGTKLRVVPHIVHDASNTRVNLEIDIEDGAISDPSLKAAVTRSTISTQAIIDVQQTLLIGGYHSETTNLSKDKVPGLGDVPLVGGLFRSTSETHLERQRLFLITPRIAGTTGSVAPTKSKTSLVAQTALNSDTKNSDGKKSEVEVSAPQASMPPIANTKAIETVAEVKSSTTPRHGCRKPAAANFVTFRD